MPEITRYCVTTRGKLTVKLFHADTEEALREIVLSICKPGFKLKVLAAIDEIIKENDEETALLKRWKREINAL